MSVFTPSDKPLDWDVISAALALWRSAASLLLLLFCSIDEQSDVIGLCEWLLMSWPGFLSVARLDGERECEQEKEKFFCFFIPAV